MEGMAQTEMKREESEPFEQRGATNVRVIQFSPYNERIIEQKIFIFGKGPISHGQSVRPY